MRQDPTGREDNRMRRFEERWREWSRRPPRQNPSQAARQVLIRLDETFPAPSSRRSFGPWTWRLATAAAAMLLAAGLWLLFPGLPSSIPGPGSQAPDAGSETETPVMADGVVLMMLGDETPLYMTFAPPQGGSGAEKGEGS